MTTQSNIVHILQSAREIIAAPAHWTKDAIALNTVGEEVPADHPKAVSWCVVGVIMKATHDVDEQYRARRVLRDALKYVLNCKFCSLTVYNDATSTVHADILRLFDAAIVRAEKGDTP